MQIPSSNVHHCQRRLIPNYPALLYEASVRINQFGFQWAGIDVLPSTAGVRVSCKTHSDRHIANLCPDS